jgi:hypothetical protein
MPSPLPSLVQVQQRCQNLQKMKDPHSSHARCTIAPAAALAAMAVAAAATAAVQLQVLLVCPCVEGDGDLR